MPCFKPLGAFQAAPGGPVTFAKGSGDGRPLPFDLYLPCGQCIGCRLERSRQWALRIMAESRLHDENCFVTLTYDEEHLPKDGSLKYRDFQLFMKRLRQAIAPVKVRFFMCGEYGANLGRPHFHACIFGYGFPDKRLFKRGKFPLFRSPLLERLWPDGISSVGELTFESAAYVARYVVDKVTGEEAEGWYSRLDVGTGEVNTLNPEFCHMSLKPGIGRGWLDRYESDYAKNFSAVSNGVEVKLPKYFERVLKSRSLLDDAVEYRKYLEVRKRIADSFPDRLAQREIVARARLKCLKRDSI